MANIILIIFSIAQTIANLKIYSNEWAVFYKLLGLSSIVFILLYNSRNKRVMETAIALFLIHSFKIFDKNIVFLDFIFVHGLSFFILVYVLYEIYKEIKEPPKKNFFNIALLLFACLGLISTVTSPCVYNALQQYLVLLDFLIITFIVANYFSREHQIRLLVNVFIVLALVLIGFAILRISGYRLRNINRLMAMRLMAQGIHPNTISGYLNIIILLSVPIFLKSKKTIFKILFLLLIIVSLLFSLLTFSRLGIFSLIFGLMLFLFITLRRGWEYLYERRFVLVLIISALSVFIIPAVNKTLAARIFNTYSNNANFYNCLVTIESLKHKLFFGVGLDNNYYLANYGDVPFLHTKNYNLTLEQTRILLNCAPHSLFLGIMFGMGAFGLIGFILIIFVAMKRAVNIINLKEDNYQNRIVLGCFLALISVLTHGVLAMVFHFTVWPAAFWVMAGIIMAADNGKAKSGLIKINKQIIKILGLSVLISAILIVFIPLSGEYYYGKAVRDKQDGNLEKALEDIEKARLVYFINPKYSEFLRDLYIELNKRKEAIEASKDLIRLKRFYAPYHIKLGELYWDSGLYAYSIEEFKKSIVSDALGVHGGEHYSKIGMAYINLGMREEAIAIYKQGARLIPFLKKSGFARELNI